MNSNVENGAAADGRWADAPVPVRWKLSALWTAVMFLYVYVDILFFYKPGTIDDILVGRVWEFDITPGWALGALILMTIPILMVVVSLIASAHLARWANLVVGSVFVVVSIGNVIDETWAFIWFGAAVETALLALVIRHAWSWSRATRDRTAELVASNA